MCVKGLLLTNLLYKNTHFSSNMYFEYNMREGKVCRQKRKGRERVKSNIFNYILSLPCWRTLPSFMMNPYQLRSSTFSVTISFEHSAHCFLEYIKVCCHWHQLYKQGGTTVEIMNNDTCTFQPSYRYKYQVAIINVNELLYTSHLLRRCNTMRTLLR